MKITDELVKVLPHRERVVVKEHGWEEGRTIPVAGKMEPEGM
jgi:hypothetical protein